MSEPINVEGVSFQQALDKLLETSNLEEAEARDALREVLSNLMAEAIHGQLEQHGVTVAENIGEASEPEPLTIDEYMYQRELKNPTLAKYYRDFGFMPLGATRSDGVEVNAERNAGQPSVAMRIMSSVSLLLYGKQRLPESVFMTPEQARALSELLMYYASCAEESYDLDYNEAKLAAGQKVDLMRLLSTDDNPA